MWWKDHARISLGGACPSQGGGREGWAVEGKGGRGMDVGEIGGKRRYEKV